MQQQLPQITTSRGYVQVGTTTNDVEPVPTALVVEATLDAPVVEATTLNNDTSNNAEAQQQQQQQQQQQGAGLFFLNVKGMNALGQEKMVRVDLAEKTLGALRQGVAREFEVPPERQRLIFNGALLRGEDSAQLETVNKNLLRVPGSVVHLMPIPKEMLAIAVENSAADREGETDEARSQRLDHIASLFVEDGNSYPHRDMSEHHQLSVLRMRVRMNAMLILFYYSMELLQACSIYFSSIKESEEDPHAKSVATRALLLIFVCIIGIRVGVIGLKASSESNHRLTRKFLIGVIFLALSFLASAVYNINQVQKEMEDETESSGMGDSKEERASMGEFGITVFIFLMMISVIWGTCIRTAGDLHRAQIREMITQSRISPSVTVVAIPVNQENSSNAPTNVASNSQATPGVVILCPHSFIAPGGN